MCRANDACRLVMLLAAVASGISVRAQSAVVLFDDFSAPLLNARWYGHQYQAGPGAGLELTREVVRGQLLLKHRVIGSTVGDTGQHVSTNGMGFNGSKEIQFDVKVPVATVTACAAANSWPAQARAGVRMAMFNDGSADVVSAVAWVGRSVSWSSPTPTAQPHAYAELWHPALQTLDLLDLGEVQSNKSSRLWMKWDDLANRVDFRVNSGPVQSIPYAEDDASQVTWRTLGVEGFVPNCTADRLSVAVEGWFDNVYLGS